MVYVKWELKLKHDMFLDFLFKYHIKAFRSPYSIFTFNNSTPSLDIEANKFYDRVHRLHDAALLTRCYTQHVLCFFIDSEMNNMRHFIKIKCQQRD